MGAQRAIDYMMPRLQEILNQAEERQQGDAPGDEPPGSPAPAVTSLH